MVNARIESHKHRDTPAIVINKRTTAKVTQGLNIKVKVKHPLAKHNHWYRLYRRFQELYIIMCGYEFIVDPDIPELKVTEEQVYLKDLSTEQLQAEIDRRDLCT